MVGPQTATRDAVVLLDQSGEPIGTAPRLDVHTENTPLHLAFSLYLFDDQNRLLLTRRALSKRTWPGVWTNTCCGHPRPGESFADAIGRRLADELGLTVTDLACALPDFAYRAIDASGVVENEICPTYTGRAGTTDGGSVASAGFVHPGVAPLPNPDEVMEWKWVPWNDVVESARRTPFVFSPWSVRQIGELAGRPERAG